MTANAIDRGPAADAEAATPPPVDTYQPGVCNIGPAEVARRRRGAWLGLLVTVAVLVAMVLLAAPPLVRLLLALPAAGAAVGYLQASRRFCVAFGSRGVENFGALGELQSVADPAARARDRARSRELIVTGLAVGALVGIAAALLPL